MGESISDLGSEVVDGGCSLDPGVSSNKTVEENYYTKDVRSRSGP